MADKELVGMHYFSIFLKNFSTVFQKIAIYHKTKFFNAFWLFFFFLFIY